MAERQELGRWDKVATASRSRRRRRQHISAPAAAHGRIGQRGARKEHRGRGERDTRRGRGERHSDLICKVGRRGRAWSFPPAYFYFIEELSAFIRES